MYENIPRELKQLPNWVCWAAVPDEKTPGKLTKVPINPFTGGQAGSNMPNTWSSYETALAVSEGYSGIGFMFGNSPYFGVDVDKIGDEIEAYQKGEYNIVSEFINTLQSYSELSQSGKGIHIICRGKLPKGMRKKGNIEMYDDVRFFVMTGNLFTEVTKIAERTEEIKPLHEKYLGGGREPAPKITYSSAIPQNAEDILKLAQSAKNASLFSSLYSGSASGYGSQSEADLALCNLLAFWCGRNADMIDCLFRRSGLMRDKWDRKQSGTTYGAITIQKAIASCTNVYEPKRTDGYSLSIGNSNGDETSGEDTETNYNNNAKLYTFDDTGNAQRFVDLFGEEIRYCYTEKSWLYYDSRKWCYDVSGTIERAADRSVEAMRAEGKVYEQMDADDGGDMFKQFCKHFKQSRSNKSKRSMINETMHHLPILPAQMDRFKLAFNTPGGVLNLKNGTLMPHSAEQYLTKISAVEYTENADCPLWLNFLNDIFGGDKDLIRYLQKAVGYSMSGSTSEQCAFFLFGTGKNGKTTFLDVIREIMGDYAVNIQPETIMIKNNHSSGINSDIARLKGARFVTTVEPNEGVRINEGLLKQLTGDDTVTARKLYEKEFEFKPEFKLWMATNHKPIIRGTDTGIWRRIHMIPFTVQIPEEKVDKHLKPKLYRELAAIMHWAVEGCILYQKESLSMPGAVYNAVKEYRKEMDVISAFLDACCLVGGEGEVRANELYTVYSLWCHTNNEYKMSNTKFGVEMKKRVDFVKNRNGTFYKSIKLLDECSEYFNYRN